MDPSLQQPEVPQFTAALRGYDRGAVHARIEQLVGDREALARRAAELEDEIATMRQAIDRHRQAPAFAVVMARLADVLGGAYEDADRIRLDSRLDARADRDRADRVVATQLDQVAELAAATAALTRAECAALLDAATRDAELIAAATTRATNGVGAAADTILRVTEDEAHARTKEVLGALLIQRKAAEAAARETVPAPARRRPTLRPAPAPTAAG